MNDCSICGLGEGEVSAIVETLLYQSNVRIGICNKCLCNMKDVANDLIQNKVNDIERRIENNEGLLKQTRKPKLVLVK
jgi:hypothetical protein